MAKYERFETTVDLNGISRSVFIIVDSETMLPEFKSSLWLMHEYHRAYDAYKRLADRVRDFMNFCNDKRFDYLNLTQAEFISYLVKYRHRELGNSASTVHQHGMSVETFLKGMQQLGFSQREITLPKNFVDENFTEDVKKHLGKQNSLDPFGLYARYLNAKEFEDLLAYVKGKSARVRLRDQLAMRLAFETGVRAAEVVNPNNFTVTKIQRALNNADGDVVEYQVLGKGKGMGKPRVIDLPVALGKELLDYHKKYLRKGNLVFVNNNHEPLRKQHCSEVFNEAKKRLIQEQEQQAVHRFDLWTQHFDTRTYHSLRHSYATHTAEIIRTAGGGLGRHYDHLRSRMGHSHAETTKIYIHFATSLFGTDEEKNELFENDQALNTRKWNSIRKDLDDE